MIDFDGANKVLIDDQIVTARQDKLTNDILILDTIVDDIKTYKKYISEI